jgi:signal peptidase II
LKSKRKKRWRRLEAFFNLPRKPRFFADFFHENTLGLKQGYKVALLIGLVLLLDQSLKFYIKTNFALEDKVRMFGLDWAWLYFVENKGMAFGIEFNVAHGDFDYGKLLLSLFRILMVAGLVWYMRVLLRAKAPMGFVFCIGLITAGALGNIIDSTFYALIFSNGDYHDGGAAQLVAFGQGYGLTEGLPMRGFLHGRVVDMFYFPIIENYPLPEWLGGGKFTFFSPIFNVADAAITTGVLSILLFQRRFFKDGFVDAPKTPAQTAEETAAQPENIFETETAEAPADGHANENGTPAEIPAESRPEENKGA